MDIFKLGDKILDLLEMVFGFWNNQVSLVFALLGQSPVDFKGGGPWAMVESVEPIFVAEAADNDNDTQERRQYQHDQPLTKPQIFYNLCLCAVNGKRCIAACRQCRTSGFYGQLFGLGKNAHLPV